MSTYDDYLTHDDKPYAENINDALLLSNVFDLTVPIELPTMFKNGYFNTSTSPRKAGVSIFTLVSYGDLTITNNSISNSESDAQTLVFKYYPNFNSYGTISSLSWTASSTGVTADIEGADGEDILTGHTGGTISGATTGLTELQEFTITLNIPAGVSISKINFVMENKDETRYGAEVGITDVNGLQTALDGKSAYNHVHGNILNGGKIGTTSGKPLITTTDGVITTTTLGNTAGTICEGNDARLSNTRQPTFTEIPSNTDLNNYKTAGFYYCSTIDISKEVANHPRTSTGGAFHLLIEAWNTTYVKQRLTYYDDSVTYIRVRKTDGWTSWRRVVMADEVFTNNTSLSNLTLGSHVSGNAKILVRNGFAWLYMRLSVKSGSTLNDEDTLLGGIDASIRPAYNDLEFTINSAGHGTIHDGTVVYHGASISSGWITRTSITYPIISY